MMKVMPLFASGKNDATLTHAYAPQMIGTRVKCGDKVSDVMMPSLSMILSIINAMRRLIAAGEHSDEIGSAR